ncbi:MAG: hypothetical protein LLG20_04170 [Acidobacteriales bacterium]|nr:hypothetical protein [Terriglobales bacterium]
MSTRGLIQARAAARMAVRERAAILLLENQVTRDMRREIQKAEQNIEWTTNRSCLRELADQTAAEIAELRGLYGITASRDELLGILEVAERVPQGHGLFLAKFRIEQLMTGYDKISADYHKLPSHALFEFDYGQLRDTPSLEVHILEASLFEDMCALFNEAHTLNSQRPASPYADKPTTKKCNAINRATITAAFYLVEAYLNGIAFDHIIENATKLTASERDLLTEWSTEKQRRRPVAFRDKLLQYPRIICGVPHPPLQENNCPEIRFLIETAKALRDAIVHASSRPDREYGMDKWCRYTNISFQDVKDTIDNAVALISSIEQTIHGSTNGIPWLQRRTADGAFPDGVFV